MNTPPPLPLPSPSSPSLVGLRLPTEDEWQVAAQAGLLARAKPLVCVGFRCAIYLGEAS